MTKPRALLPRGQAGLTFLELLLAVAVSGLILTASSQILFSFAHFWQQSELEPRFDRHVDGVTGFIEYCFERSMIPSRNGQRRFAWRMPPETTHPTFHFRLASAHPLFVTEVRPPPPVDAWLEFDEERGLSMLWHIPPALTEETVVLHSTPLSCSVKDVEIGYFDKSRNIWEFESLTDRSRGRRRPAPGALRILFEQNGRERLRYIRMERCDRHVLMY